MQDTKYFWAKTYGGKPGTDVSGHGLNTGAVAFALACRMRLIMSVMGLEPEAVAFLASVHDVGKISFDFQTMHDLWREEHGLRKTDMRTPHGVYTAQALMRFLYDECGRADARFWAVVCGSHHGRIVSLPEGMPAVEKPRGRTKEPDWENERRALMRAMRAIWECSSLPQVDMRSPLLWFAAGLVSLADWIASDERFFPADKSLSLEESAAHAEKALNMLGMEYPQLRNGIAFEKIFGFEPNSLQKLVIASVRSPGLYIIEAPMGMGKTEAALGAVGALMAGGMARGMYFALPTQVTSNRIWLRVRDFCEQVFDESDVPRLIHSASWLHEEIGKEMCSHNEDAVRWYASPKRALFARMGVGTVDQALMSVLAVRHFFMRRFALAGKVVIIDEVHSYDAYTGTLVEAACRELVRLGCTVIILSATLTASARRRLLEAGVVEENASRKFEEIGRMTEEDAGAPSVLLSAVPCAGLPFSSAAKPPSSRRIAVRTAEKTELLQIAERLYDEGACILWICDTVASAQDVYSELADRGRIHKGDLGLLHSRFIRETRDSSEALWLERLGKGRVFGSGCVLVATQVVEQSVDLDADALITELAPTDMLLQRMGRLQRHDRGPRPWEACCWIQRENLEGAENVDALRVRLGAKGYVYYPDILARSWAIWKNLEQISLPEDIRPLLERTYEDDAAWDMLGGLEREGKELAMQNMAMFSSNIWGLTGSDVEDVQRFSTRLSETPTENIILCRAVQAETVTLYDGSTIAAEEGKWSMDTARRLALNTVRIAAGYATFPVPAFLRKYHADGLYITDGVFEADKSSCYNDEMGFYIRKQHA